MQQAKHHPNPMIKSDDEIPSVWLVDVRVFIYMQQVVIVHSVYYKTYL